MCCRLNRILTLPKMNGERAQSDIKVTTSSGLVITSVDANRRRIRHENDLAGPSSPAAYRPAGPVLHLAERLFAVDPNISPIEATVLWQVKKERPRGAFDTVIQPSYQHHAVLG